MFVFPSEVENFPVVLLEAMSAGLAIITTRGTGCEEVVGRAALLVTPRDSDAIWSAIRRLANDPDLAGTLGTAARKRLVAHFSWQTVAERYHDLYRQLAG